VRGKKAKELRRMNEKKILFEYHITVFNDNSVNITGPIHDLYLFRRSMNDAEKAVLDFLFKNKKPNIIVPQVQVPFNIKVREN